MSKESQENLEDLANMNLEGLEDMEDLNLKGLHLENLKYNESTQDEEYWEGKVL